MTALFDPAVFRPEAVAPETAAFTENLRRVVLGAPPPEGEAPGPLFGERTYSPRAVVRSIDAGGGRQVGVRIIAPDSPRGAYLHLHGGGLIMGSADQEDHHLERIADHTGLAVVAVDYRLAPAHPYPARGTTRRRRRCGWRTTPRPSSAARPWPSAGNRPAPPWPSRPWCACATSTASPAFRPPTSATATTTPPVRPATR